MADDVEDVGDEDVVSVREAEKIVNKAIPEFASLEGMVKKNALTLLGLDDLRDHYDNYLDNASHTIYFSLGKDNHSISSTFGPTEAGRSNFSYQSYEQFCAIFAKSIRNLRNTDFNEPTEILSNHWCFRHSGGQGRITYTFYPRKYAKQLKKLKGRGGESLTNIAESFGAAIGTTGKVFSAIRRGIQKVSKKRGD